LSGARRWRAFPFRFRAGNLRPCGGPPQRQLVRERNPARTVGVDNARNGRISMILVVFAILAVTGQVLNVFLCLALDQIFSPIVGGTAFVFLYMLVFVVAWLLSVWIVERRQGRPQEGQAVERQHIRQPNLQTSAR
jgi:Fe2+ transport system protein B